MASPRQPADGVQNLLDEAESELSRRLREACEAEARGVATESAEEIRELEDALLSAAMAAGRVRAARRHLSPDSGDPEPGRTAASGAENREPARRATGPDPESPAPCDPESEGTSVREFEDTTGRSWRAWPVTPRMARAREGRQQILGDYQEGWICFEALDNQGRRRLPRREPRWSELPADELQRLLDQAIDAPGRRLKKPGGTTGPERHDVH